MSSLRASVARTQLGFTLIEVMIVLAVAGVMATVFGNALRGTIEHQRTVDALYDVENALVGVRNRARTTGCIHFVSIDAASNALVARTDPASAVVGCQTIEDVAFTISQRLELKHFRVSGVDVAEFEFSSKGATTYLVAGILTVAVVATGQGYEFEIWPGVGSVQRVRT